MKNVYLIYSLDKNIIDNKVNELIKKSGVTDISVVKYFYEDNMSEIIEDASTVNLFGGNKLIIVENSNFFNNSDNNIKLLESYLDNVNKDVYLIFTLISDKVDSRKKILKKIKEIGEVYEHVNPDDGYIYNYIENYLKENNYKMDKDMINKFIKKIGHNVGNVKNELDKLFLTAKDGNIDISEINNMEDSNDEENIFGLIDSIVNKNIEKSIKLYHYFLNQNEEVIKIISLLANKYRLIYQVKKLYAKNMNKYDIAKKLEVHHYPVSLAITTGFMYTEKELLKILKELYNLDLNIKKGLINDKVGLEMFIIKSV